MPCPGRFQVEGVQKGPQGVGPNPLHGHIPGVFDSNGMAWGVSFPIHHKTTVGICHKVERTLFHIPVCLLDQRNGNKRIQGAFDRAFGPLVCHGHKDRVASTTRVVGREQILLWIPVPYCLSLFFNIPSCGYNVLGACNGYS